MFKLYRVSAKEWILFGITYNDVTIKPALAAAAIPYEEVKFAVDIMNANNDAIGEFGIFKTFTYSRKIDSAA